MATERELRILVTGKYLAKGILKAFNRDLLDIGKIAAGALGAMGIAGLAKKAAESIQGLVREGPGLLSMSVAFDNIAAAAGTSGNAILAAMKKGSYGALTNAKAMESFNTASNLVSRQFAKTLPEAMQYFTKINLATGKSIDYLLSSYVTGVGRLSGPILDNLEVQVSLTQATKKASEMFGVAAGALTKEQTQAGMAAITLEALKRNTEALPDPTGMAAIEAARFAATLQDVRDSAATSLAPAIGTLMGRFNQLADRVVPKLTAIIETRLGPALDIIADGLVGLSHKAEAAGDSFIARFGGRMEEAANRALTWGVNISAQLASGIVQGAASALTAAMNWISGALANWLAPGSPPKVAPMLDKWGLSWFDELMGGFTSGDMSVLSGMTGALQTALGSLSSMGVIAQDKVGGMLASLTGEIAQTVSEFNRTGVVGGAIFEKLTRVAGPFGKHLAGMLRSQLDLAAATKALKSAQDRLNSARTKETAASDAIKRLKKEYSDLRKAGASDEALKAKYQEIRAAQRGLHAAKAETAAAAKAEEEARKKLSPLQDQARLQEQMVNQLAQLVQLQAKSMGLDKTGLGKGKPGAPTIPIPELPPIPKPQLGSFLTAFDEGKKHLQGVFKDLFKPFTEAWENDMKPAIEQVKGAWSGLRANIGAFWDDARIQKIREWIAGLFPEGTAETIGKWAGQILVAVAALIALKAILAIVTSPIILLGAAIVLLAGLWTKHGEEITQTTLMLVAIVLAKMLELRQFLIDTWENIREALKKVWDNIGVALAAAGLTWYNNITEQIKAVLQWIRDKVADFKSLGSAIVDGIKEGISDAAGSLARKAASAAKAALDAAKRALGIQSPSSVAAEQVGKPIMQGIGLGAVRNLRYATQPMGAAMGSLFGARPGLGVGAALGARAAGAGAGGPVQINVTVEGHILNDRIPDRLASAIADRINRVTRLRGVRTIR